MGAFSELLPYTYAGETRIADFTNMHRIGPGYTFVPWEPIEISFDYDALFADENTFEGEAGFSDGGAFRGHLLSSWLKYTINRHVSGHVMGEVFFPGNYYDETREDTAFFLHRGADVYLVAGLGTRSIEEGVRRSWHLFS